MLDELYAKVRPGPPKPSKVYLPSQFTLPSGTERYVVEGMGAILIPVPAGDQITLNNDKGAQVCEVVAAGKGGKIDPGVLNAPANGTAAGLRALLTSSDQSLRGLRKGLEARGINLANVQSLRIFDTDTTVRTQENLHVLRDGSLIIAAPGNPMDIERQDTTTPITAMIKRAVLKTTCCL